MGKYHRSPLGYRLRFVFEKYMAPVQIVNSRTVSPGTLQDFSHSFQSKVGTLFFLTVFPHFFSFIVCLFVCLFVSWYLPFLIYLIFFLPYCVHLFLPSVLEFLVSFLSLTSPLNFIYLLFNILLHSLAFFLG